MNRMNESTDDDDLVDGEWFDDDDDDDSFEREIDSLRSAQSLSRFTKNQNNDYDRGNDEKICCKYHDCYAKKVGAFLPTERDDYHQEIPCPSKRIWLYDHFTTFKDQDRSIKHAHYHYDYLDDFLKLKFFEVFAVKACEKCFNPDFLSCEPVCPQPIVKSPLVSKSSDYCLLKYFNICVGRCAKDGHYSDSHIVCGCWSGARVCFPARRDYRNSCSPAFKSFLRRYNADNDLGHTLFEVRYDCYLILADYAQILIDFVGWLTQAYPKIDIKKSYEIFKNENSKDFMKIKFEIVSYFRYMVRKKFLEKSGLVDKANFEEFPPVCR